jgi:hypothetical protein
MDAVPPSRALSRRLPTCSLYSWGYNKYAQLGHGDVARSNSSSGGPGGRRDAARIVGADGGFDEAGLPVPSTPATPPREAEGGDANWRDNDGNSTNNGVSDDDGNHGHDDAIGGVAKVVTSDGQPLAVVTIVSINAGWVHCLAADGDGRCWGWGGNNNGTVDGQLLLPPPLPPRATTAATHTAPPTQPHIPTLQPSVLHSAVRVPFPPSVRVRAVACGLFHSAAIDHEGNVWTWGSGLHGKLGHGDVEPRFRPTCVLWLAL